ncbi:MAG: protein-ribulosamine 3-kinase [Chlamydiales bacterium]|jgi:protein-ribulosamine 3-kinase
MKANRHDDGIAQALRDRLNCNEVISVSPIGGGCINEAYCYSTDVGSFFVKINKNAAIQMFEGEVRGLKSLYESHSVRVPKVFFCDQLPNGGSFLVLEYIKLGTAREWTQRDLGGGLADQHLCTEESRFGFHVDNTIGSTPQINTWMEEWVSFFARFRLQYQLDLAFIKSGDELMRDCGHRLLDRLPGYFEGQEISPSLLHGDLWSGNMAVDEQGHAVIYDPAVYYGHHEAELGIMGMFGGFTEDFYKAYHEKIPEAEGFKERRELYKLYHYLNHLNIFGSSYYSFYYEKPDVSRTGYL